MAVSKDYYRILNIRSSATAAEIKNAYRKIAMAYHPDRNPEDALAAAVFSDAAEAYKVLSDNDSRKRYNYERYLTAEEEYKRPVETIEALIARAKKLSAYVKQSDLFRINKSAVLYTIQQLFPDDLNLLKQTDHALLQEFLEQVTTAAEYLYSAQTKQLSKLLMPFYAEHAWLQYKLNSIIQQQQREERWEKNKIILAIVIAAILCVIIFLVSKT
jgi:curved DNA-binding protein CbpA